MKTKRFFKRLAVCLTALALVSIVAGAVSASSGGSVAASFGSPENRELTAVNLWAPTAEAGNWTEADEAVKLEYSNHRVFGAYRIMYGFKSANVVGSRTWVTVTFKTNTTEKAKLVYASNAGAYADNPLWGVNLVTLCDDVSVSGGEWVTTAPFNLDIKDSQILARLNSAAHNTLYFTIEGKDAEVYIKEMRFFASEREANAYIEKLKNAATSDNSEPVVYDMSTYEIMRKNIVSIIGNYNAASYNKEEGAFKLNYYDDPRTQDQLGYDRQGTGAYGMRFQFVSRKDLTTAHKYVCITYKTNCDGAYTLEITNDNWGYGVELVNDISVSAGQYVTSTPAKLPEAFLEYICSGKDLWITSNTLNRGVDLNIRAIAFFTSEEQALNYYNLTKTAPDTDISITVEGTPITDYTVIVPAGEEARMAKAVKAVTDAIKNATGKELAVKTDAEPVSAHEILIGATNRPESFVYFDAVTGKYATDELGNLDFCAACINGKLVIMADLTAVLEQTVGQFTEAYLTKDYNFANGFEVSCVCDERESGSHFKNYPFTKVEKSFETPNTYKDDFEDETVGEDPDYWSEDPIDTSTFMYAATYGKKIDMTSFDKFSENAEINPDVKGSAATDTSKGYYDAWIGAWQFEDGHVKVVSRTSGMTQGGAYRFAFMPKKGIVTDEYKYMCVTYKVNATEDLKGKLELRMGDSVIVINDSLTATNGDFVVSAPVDISTDSVLFNRWKGGSPHNAICFNFGSVSTGVDAYVKEVTFFDSLDNANKYASGELTALVSESAPTSVADDWKTAADGGNTVYAVKTDDRSFSFLHTFERDIEFTAKMKLTAKGDNAQVGLACRINDDLAYVMAGYDAKSGKWFIESRQGEPYMTHIAYGDEASVEVGTWYTLKLVANDGNVSLYVNGSAAPVVSAPAITHRSPGRLALFADNAEVMFDDADVILTSCQSRIEKGVVTMTLPLSGFAEGGTVLSLNDGSLLFLHQDEQLVSKDMGLSWENTYWAKIVQHANVLRLASGKILRLEEITVDGVAYYAATVTSDEGNTWSTPVPIAPIKFNKTTGGSCIMNDKFMQMSDGRIFFSCTYNGVNGNTAHVEMYYSDDDGTTWTKSNTSSMDIYEAKSFAESKIVETTDGKLRMLTTWNSEKCMTYNESSDNGVTWGPTVLMEDFLCCCSSSDVFRDPETGTYYLVWVYNELRRGGMPRARLSLAMSNDGINWQYCMDVDRWESPFAFENGTLAHIVDPFVKVVDGYVFVGTGFSETLGDYKNNYHKGQIERLYRIDKDSIVPYDVWPSTTGNE